MKLKLIEVTNRFNWGKFAIGTLEPEEGSYPSVIEEADDEGYPRSLIVRCGWTRPHRWFLDLQTGEGAFLRPGGSVRADLAEHRIWVCPMFEPFLEWTYRQDLTDLDALPAVVELTEAEAPSSMYGYRRTGERGDVRVHDPAAFSPGSAGSTGHCAWRSRRAYRCGPAVVDRRITRLNGHAWLALCAGCAERSGVAVTQP